MSVFSSSISHRSFYWQISTLCFVLGLLLAAAWHTASQINRAGIGDGRAGFTYGSGVQVAAKKAKEYEAEINKKSEYIKELEEKISKGTSAASMLNEELQKTRFVAGLTETVGPGIVVTLMDSRKQPVSPIDQFQQKNLIHDVDILNVVNELKATGAEAISVNGQRIITSSAVRCVGPVVHVNGVPVAPSYVIEAIGAPETLYNGLNIQNGVLDELRRYDSAMVRVDKKKKLVLPAFAGSTQMLHSRPPVDTSHSSKDKSK
jgi:uncharacterized protein YlxW (UPF0749 family)